uniref:two-pore potassium channel 1-like n=1 Tax=Erigeron canadensis TaxID=72917 RepID=UPI001CB9A3C1|nr:two-pore potassium channel 1-like [Erigeron canadensis]
MGEEGLKDVILKRRKHKGKHSKHSSKHENEPPPAIPGIQLNLTQVATLLCTYLGVGTIIFYLVRDQMNGKKTNGLLDSIYFCVVTMTTVGYGDIVPETNFAKLLACVFVFIGMGLGGFVLSKAADYIVEREVSMFVKAINDRETYGPDQIFDDAEHETTRLKYKFLLLLTLIVVLVIIGTVFLIVVEDMSFIDAYYCVCATITTLGYGDKSFSSKRGRVFAIVWILTSTIALAQLFVYLVELWTQSKQRQLVDWVLRRKLTIQDIENADLDNDKSVSPAEYVVYKLKEMGLVSDQLIMNVMEGFKNLDVDQSGTLTRNDLSASCRQPR